MISRLAALVSALSLIVMSGSASIAQQAGTPILSGPLVKLDIKAAEIEPTRGTPRGTLTIAQHFALDPGWLNPLTHSYVITQQKYDYLVHDALIKTMPQGVLTYSLADHAEQSADYKQAAFRLRERVSELLGQYLNLLKELQQAGKVALIFVTHNLGIVAKMCDTVAVMYAGKIVEMQSVRGLFYAPRHPYTRALLDSIPRLGTKEPLYAVPGQPPDLAALPSGCSFHPRCAHAMERCRTEEPGNHRDGGGGMTRCWLAETQGAGNG